MCVSVSSTNVQTLLTTRIRMLVIMNIVALFLDAFQKETNDGTAFSNTILTGCVTIWSFQALLSLILILNRLSANLIARFILDLRSVYEEGSSISGTTGTGVSSVRFDPRSLAGNMGAPLGIENSTWVSGPSDDVIDNFDEKYEEVAIPFRAGLGLEIEVPLEAIT